MKLIVCATDTPTHQINVVDFVSFNSRLISLKVV